MRVGRTMDALRLPPPTHSFYEINEQWEAAAGEGEEGASAVEDAYLLTSLLTQRYGIGTNALKDPVLDDGYDEEVGVDAVRGDGQSWAADGGHVGRHPLPLAHPIDTSRSVPRLGAAAACSDVDSLLQLSNAMEARLAAVESRRARRRLSSSSTNDGTSVERLEMESVSDGRLSHRSLTTTSVCEDVDYIEVAEHNINGETSERADSAVALSPNPPHRPLSAASTTTTRLCVTDGGDIEARDADSARASSTEDFSAPILDETVLHPANDDEGAATPPLSTTSPLAQEDEFQANASQPRMATRLNNDGSCRPVSIYSTAGLPNVFASSSDQQLSSRGSRRGGYRARVRSSRQSDTEPTSPWELPPSVTAAMESFAGVMVRAVIQVDAGEGMGVHICSDDHHPGVFLRMIERAGPVGRAGKFRPGDRIIAINGVDLLGADHDDVVREMLAVDDLLDLAVSRETSPLTDNHSDDDPLTAVGGGPELHSPGPTVATARELEAREPSSHQVEAATIADPLKAQHYAGSPKKLEWFFGRDPSRMLLTRNSSVPLLGHLVSLRPGSPPSGLASLSEHRPATSATSADSGGKIGGPGAADEAGRLSSRAALPSTLGVQGAASMEGSAMAAVQSDGDTESEPVVRRLTADDVHELVSSFDTHASLVLHRRPPRSSVASSRPTSSSSTSSSFSSYDRSVSSSSLSSLRRGGIARHLPGDARTNHRFSYRVTLTSKKHWGRFQHLGDF